MPLINLPLLHDLITELDDLPEDPAAQQRREDLHYTLCVSLGLRDPYQAQHQARCLLASHHATTATAA